MLDSDYGAVLLNEKTSIMMLYQTAQKFDDLLIRLDLILTYLLTNTKSEVGTSGEPVLVPRSTHALEFRKT